MESPTKRVVNIWLDDERPAPEGEHWVSARWPEDVIKWLCDPQVEVEIIDLDNDLGEGRECTHPRKGKQVLQWLEEQVFKGLRSPPPYIMIHTRNPVAEEEMKIMACRIYDQHDKNVAEAKQK